MKIAFGLLGRGYSDMRSYVATLDIADIDLWFSVAYEFPNNRSEYDSKYKDVWYAAVFL